MARLGPWPVASKPVAYGGRLWFANSVKGRNHNSADLYSYDPVKGGLRYERHLFSQDAGDPLVFRGLLYWPFEDARFSALTWTAETDPGTAVRFQVRSARHRGVLKDAEWTGPGGAETFYDAPGAELEGVPRRNRWLQYKAVFTSPGGTASARLVEVGVACRE